MGDDNRISQTWTRCHGSWATLRWATVPPKMPGGGLWSRDEGKVVAAAAPLIMWVTCNTRSHTKHVIKSYSTSSRSSSSSHQRYIPGSSAWLDFGFLWWWTELGDKRSSGDLILVVRIFWDMDMEMGEHLLLLILLPPLRGEHLIVEVFWSIDATFQCSIFKQSVRIILNKIFKISDYIFRGFIRMIRDLIFHAINFIRNTYPPPKASF